MESKADMYTRRENKQGPFVPGKIYIPKSRMPFVAFKEKVAGLPDFYVDKDMYLSLKHEDEIRDIMPYDANVLTRPVESDTYLVAFCRYPVFERIRVNFDAQNPIEDCYEIQLTEEDEDLFKMLCDNNFFIAFTALCMIIENGNIVDEEYNESLWKSLSDFKEKIIA